MYFRTDTEKNRLNSAKKLVFLFQKCHFLRINVAVAILTNKTFFFIFLGELPKALHTPFSTIDGALL